MDVLTYYIDETAPAIVRKLSTQYEGDYDIVPGAAFRLRVRDRWGSAEVLNAVMTPNTTSDEISYQPVTGDFDTEGVYRAWVYVDLGSGVVQSTDEFQINVFAHAPGEGTRVGAIYRACRALEPVSWDSLRHYPDYGDPELQRVIELAKLRVLPSATAVADETSLDPRVVDFIAKKALVDNVLYAAISFWSDQVIQQTARGNSEEIVTYADRIKTAENAMARYRDDLERQLPEVDAILGSLGTTYPGPVLSDYGPMLTPGLDEYPALPITVPRQPWWTR